MGYDRLKPTRLSLELRIVDKSGAGREASSLLGLGSPEGVDALARQLGGVHGNALFRPGTTEEVDDLQAEFSALEDVCRQGEHSIETSRFGFEFFVQQGEGVEIGEARDLDEVEARSAFCSADLN